MKTKNPQALSWLLLAISGVYLLVACQAKNNSSPGPIQVAAQGSPQQGSPTQSPTSPPKSAGTSDSGGGTGIDNKVYESYIVDILKHRAYLEHVEPLMKNLIDTKNGSDKDAGLDSFKKFFAYKTWYIAPIDLEKIGKDTLGISVHQSDTQQLARQTKKEIWIDSRIFEKMTAKAQGDLILHEMIMALYFVKFMSYSELCLAGVVSITVEGKDVAADCKNLPKIFEKMLKAEEFRPLNAQDNENIRHATGWVLNNAGSKGVFDEWMRVLIMKNFDRRFFKIEKKNLTNSSPEIKVTGQQIFEAIKATEVSGFALTLCRDLDGDSERPCQLLAKVSSIKMSGFEIPTIEVDLQIAGQSVQKFEFPMNSEMLVSTNVDDEGIPFYSFAASSINAKLKLGDRTAMGLMIFRPSHDSTKDKWRLDSLLVKFGVLAAVNKDSAKICDFRTPKKNKAFDTGLIMRRQDSKPEMFGEVLSEFSPPGYCSTQTQFIE
jgi:hypothetical protein